MPIIWRSHLRNLDTYEASQVIFMDLITKDAIDEAIKNTANRALVPFPVSDDDASIIIRIACSLDRNGSGHSIMSAVICLADYRQRSRQAGAEAFAEAIPVRKAANVALTGSRFYWRVVTKGGIFPVCKMPNRIPAPSIWHERRLGNFTSKVSRCQS